MELCTKVFELYQVSKRFQWSQLAYIKSITQFPFFFWSSDTHQSYYLMGCHTTGINSSFNSFLSVFRFSNLICLIKKLFWLGWKLKQYAWQKAIFIRLKIDKISLIKKIRLKIKTICLRKNRLWIVIKITVFYN